MAQWCLYAPVLLVLLFCNVDTMKKKKVADNLSNGWGDDIVWVKTYEEGLQKSKESNKPLMVIHHLNECQYSQAVKKVFVEDKEIQKMGQEDFIMFNTLQETGDENMAPDGHYVPRILFVDPSYTVRNDIMGKYYNRKYAYEPGDMDFLKDNMGKAKILLHTEL